MLSEANIHKLGWAVTTNLELIELELAQVSSSHTLHSLYCDKYQPPQKSPCAGDIGDLTSGIEQK